MAQQNKFGIVKTSELMPIEEKISKLRAREMYDKGMLKDIPATFDGLAKIHKYMFTDVYPFAGEKRTVDVLRGKMIFTPLKNLDTELGFIDIMPSDNFDDIVNKYIEMNIAHPFRAGNGRVMRIWLDVMLSRALGGVVDWSKISKQAFRPALDNSSTDDEALYELIKGAFTRDTGRETFMRALDASFAYEGFDSYKTSQL